MGSWLSTPTLTSRLLVATITPLLLGLCTQFQPTTIRQKVQVRADRLLVKPFYRDLC
jgi:hypothetical protein